MAFDALHRFRKGKRLAAGKIETLAALLDFAAGANATLDHKDCCRHDSRITLQLLEAAGIRATVVEYVRKLRDLENRRPLPGGDQRRFQEVVLYREAVVRLSLGMVATTADGDLCLDEAIRATRDDVDLHILFRIVMQCQIIDDVLDYSEDVPAGLPGFLTACKSLPQAFELTRLAAVGYAEVGDLPRTGDVYLLRLSLFLVSTCARLAILLGRRGRRGSRCTPAPGAAA